MDALITNGIEPAHLGGAEKRSADRDWAPRRKRPLLPPNGKDDSDPAPDAPKHALDDLA